MTGSRVRAGLLVAAAGAVGWAPAPAAAKDGDDRRSEVRQAATCGKGASARLRLRSRDGEIRVDFELSERRSGNRWTVVVVHERRVEARIKTTTRGAGHRFEVRRTVTDYAGADEVRIRASGPRGLTCTATATLAE